MATLPSESDPRRTAPVPSPAPTPAGKIRILHVEDNPADAELIRLELRRGGIDADLKVVDSLRDCEAALAKEKFDLIISDYNLPGGDGVQVLHGIRKNHTAIPFIFVSGTIGEEKAIEAIKSGATDYVLKDRLSRIPLAVRRAVDESRERERARQLQSQLVQAQKMEAIGRLAGGVAHDFNNMLTVINGYSELLLSQTDANDPRRPEIEEIRNAGERAAGLTRQLLTFSRRQVFQPTTLDLNAILRGLEKMVGRLIGEDIKLVLRLATELHPVNADAGQIEQVVVNLVVNARDAMPAGGKILIETSNVDLDEAFSSQHPELKPGPHSLIKVSDTGGGISSEVKEHLFEPFFTTKEKGKGTGLGLSTALGIVQQCGGMIQLAHETGWGATFRIYLPRSGKDLQPSAPAPAGASVARGTETVLIAEDLDTVRRLAERILTGAGYRVLMARDGTDALRMFEERDEKIHLLMADVVMRSMTGPELAGLVHRTHPETKILFISGYTDQRLAELAESVSGAGFLQKPFTVEGLKRKVREVLDRPSGQRP
jgi:signal transduction histidine kinase